MDRRSFVQNAGAAVLSAFPSGVMRMENSAEARPGKVLAIAAHPGDGMFTMGAALGQQIERGGAGVLLSLSAGERGAPFSRRTQLCTRTAAPATMGEALDVPENSPV